MLREKVGDHVVVHFRNELPEPTTVHWHGPRVPHHADGTHGSQPAVHPGQTFRYHFEARDAGTFWYHPHVNAHEQIERGLHGPIVLAGGVVPEVSADRVLLLDDVELVVEIWEIDNGASMDHPVRLHGMFFDLLPGARDRRPRPGGWKDTVNIPRSSTVRFAVRFDTPGVWLFQCHILEHGDAGMMVDLVVRE
jgi:FtsP/CotA-like multicopper oxidase with cupredoxin domain